MAWGRIDDSLYDHPKLNDLGRYRLPCIGLWTVAISWSNRYLTDGHVPTAQVKRLGGTRLLAEMLVRVGLWDQVADGYRVHDYLQFNQSRQEVENGRTAARERMRRSRELRENFANTRPRASPVQSVPIPIPVPEHDANKTRKKADA